MRLESSFQIAPNWPKIEKITMTSQFADKASLPNFLDVVLCLLSSLVTCPSFKSISSLSYEVYFHKRLTRNLKIRNTTIWVLPNIWRLRRVRDAKFSTNGSNKMSLIAAKWQSYSFYRFWIIKGKPTGG